MKAARIDHFKLRRIRKRLFERIEREKGQFGVTALTYIEDIVNGKGLKQSRLNAE